MSLWEKITITFFTFNIRDLKQQPGNNDDDGRENIIKKMNLRPFKLYRVYLKPHNSSNVG